MKTEFTEYVYSIFIDILNKENKKKVTQCQNKINKNYLILGQCNSRHVSKHVTL